MRREICRRTSTAVTQLWLRAVVTRKTPNGSDRKTEICSIFDVYDKCVRKAQRSEEGSLEDEQRKERSLD